VPLGLEKQRSRSERERASTRCQVRAACVGANRCAVYLRPGHSAFPAAIVPLRGLSDRRCGRALQRRGGETLKQWLANSAARCSLPTAADPIADCVTNLRLLIGRASMPVARPLAAADLQNQL
jgi:hypothetical protein